MSRPIGNKGPSKKPVNCSNDLLAWTNSHAAAAGALAKRRDIDGPMLDRALDMVRVFLAERRLLVFGGFAIDCALRLHGDSIYPDEERPDYDALSPRSVDDAYALADILFQAGFEHVDAIRAVHIQTMRVRVNYRPVADLGYVPPQVYEKIPRLTYKDLNIVHPDFQRMDMHLAFCFPFSGAPREDVFHRWQKDLKRYNLLSKYYKIEVEPTISSESVGMGVTLTAEFTIPIVGKGKELKMALTGFAGYAALRLLINSTAKKLGRSIDLKAPVLRLRLEKNHIDLEMPLAVQQEIVTISPDPESALLNATEYAPYGDIYPGFFKKDNSVVLSSRGRLIAVSLVRLCDSESESDQVYVATPQHILLYFLQWANRSEGEARLIYRNYYAHTLEILQAAEDIFTESFGATAETADIFEKSPFAPTVCTLGTINTDPAYIIKMANYAARLHDKPPASLGLDPDLAQILKGLPVNYYPKASKSQPAFDYNVNHLYQRYGQKLTKTYGF